MIFKGFSLQQIKQFFLEGESPTLKYRAWKYTEKQYLGGRLPGNFPEY